MTKPIATAFTTIDSSALDVVTGGATGRADRDERILEKLASLTSALGDLAAGPQNQKGNDPMAALMPILMMKMMKPGGATGGGVL